MRPSARARRAAPVDLDPQLRRALEEDRVAEDRTSQAVVPPGARLRARIVAQAAGVVSGVAVAERLARRVGLTVRQRARDGSSVRPGHVVLELQGNARKILGVERTILNYLMHLSGVASETRRAVRAAKGRVRVLATRKTTPGLRDLEKAAVVHGGGAPNRRDLSDALLVKSTHVRLVGLRAAVERALAAAPRGVPLEVEVRSPAEAVRAADLGARALLLDNMSPSRIRATVRAIRARTARPRVRLEASGGIRPDNVARYAGLGLDEVSLGGLTHSAPALPFHLVVVALSRRRRPAR